MAKRIDELDAMSGTVASDDFLFIEDVSSNKTKKVKVSTLFANIQTKLLFEEVSYSDDTTLTSDDMGKGLLVTITATSKTVTLPALTDGYTVFIRNAGTNAFTLAADGTEKIAGDATLTLSATDYVYLVAVPDSGVNNGWTTVSSQIT
jgi:hypothetical protein